MTMRARSGAVVVLLAALLVATPARAQDPAPAPSTTAATAPDPAAPPASGATGADPAAADPGAGIDPAPAAPGGGAGATVDAGRSAAGDPLAANGLGGALCRSDRLGGALSAAARANCRTAGVSHAPAPVTDYGFDIHIDLGTFGISTGAFAAAVQTLILTPAWTFLLWIVHAVLAVLEWSYALDLLDPGTVGGLTSTLRSAGALFTQPWLPAVLAVAAVVLTYRALVRRAVAESAGQAAATAAMIIAGLALIADPAGTVGRANAIVQQASLGTVAAVGGHDPAQAEASFGDALSGVFAAAVEGPWCYLEFGDVDWCRNPARRDDRLARAARTLAGPDSGLRCGPRGRSGRRGGRGCGTSRRRRTPGSTTVPRRPRRTRLTGHRRRTPRPAPGRCRRRPRLCRGSPAGRSRWPARPSRPGRR